MSPVVAAVSRVLFPTLRPGGESDGTVASRIYILVRERNRKQVNKHLRIRHMKDVL